MQSRRRFIVAGIAGASFGIAGCSGNNDSEDNGNGGGNDTPEPWTIVDDTRSLEEDEYLSWDFTLNRQATLKLSAIVRDGPAADILLTSVDEFNEFEQDNRFRYNSAVSLMDSGGGSTSGLVSSGSYVFVLDNTNAGEAKPPTNFSNDVVEIEVELQAIY